MRLFLRIATAAVVVSLAPATLSAQANADADTGEVHAYRLTMSKLKQLDTFFTDFYRQREADPAYQELLKKKRELAVLNAKDELTDAELERLAQLEDEIADAEDADDQELDADQSLSAMAQRMTADPRVARSLERAGLKAREAATMQLAFFEAALTAGLLDTGTIKEIPKEVNAENVKFYQANRAEIAALTALGDSKGK